MVSFKPVRNAMTKMTMRPTGVSQIAYCRPAAMASYTQVRTAMTVMPTIMMPAVTTVGMLNAVMEFYRSVPRPVMMATIIMATHA